MNRLPLLAAVCAMLAACSSERPGGPLPTITDSAGVAIVTAPSLETLPSRVLTGPILDLATSQDSADASFSSVSSVLRLADGRLVVADGASRRLKVFGPDGSYRRTLGGSQADGAGLSAITALWAIDANRIAAFDRRHRTLYTMSLDGGPVHAAPLAMPPANPRAVGRLATGDVLMRTLVRDTPEIGFEVSEVAITRWREDGSLVDTVGVWPSARMGLLGQPPVQLVSSPIFEPRMIGAAAGDRLLVSDCRTGQYLVIDPEVGLERVVRWPAKQDSVTAADIAAYRARRLDSLSPEQQRQARYFLDERPINETMPACDQIRIDVDGRAWVRSFVRPSAAMQRWLVFDPSGGPQFRVELPVDALLMDAGPDYIVVMERRPLDVARIRVYGVE